MLARSAAMMCAAGVLVLVGCSGGDDGRNAEPAHPASTATSSSAPSSSAPPPPSRSAPTPSASPSPSATAAASARPSPVPVTGPDQKLVVMTVSGGFAGVNQEVTLRGDGSVRTADKGRSAVRRTTTAQFTQLRTLLGDPALDDIPAFTRDTGSADRFQYALQFDGRTIMTDRSAGEPALDRLIGALEKWLPKN
ncbi:hypothetical protein QFZ56_000528 [Streptomyces achromogenes]|uniref:Lipoprotein n=1 Tax=Streptomyces achromogenes TaxID=67255 RepID=A0ABU0PT46_STRAH|nr:hypothetical protein [Streptomyces achromogenes]MDQ0681565.1 hypothetical protein [Streptomyces achromogenes]